MVSPFPTLAVELIGFICSSLERPDLFALRLVCRDLNLKTFHYFIHTCFTRLEINLSRNSLQSLKELSEYEELRLQVQELVIWGSDDIWRDLTFNRNPSDHHLVALSLDRDELCDIHFKFVNCRSFEFYSLDLYLRRNVNSLSFIERLSFANDLPSLQELHLSTIKIPEDVLSRLILRFRKSLRTIFIRFTIIGAHGGWSSIFREWKGKFPLLDRINLNVLKEVWGNSRMTATLFPALYDSPRAPGTENFKLLMVRFDGKPVAVEYKGPRINDALEMLASSAVSNELD